MIGLRRRSQPAPRVGAPEPPGPLLEVRGLCAGYGPVQVLFDVDLSVEAGTVVAVLGANGAGKTTLLRALTGLLVPTAGSIHLDGEEVTGRAVDDIATRGVAMVPGGAGVFPSLSVEENLRVAAWQWPKGVPGGGLVDVLAELPVLAERRSSPAGDLSGGQQQMLALAMALLGRPRLLLIDELSMGLAPTIVGRLLPMLVAAREAGTAVVLVEQTVDVALAVADVAIQLEHGQIRSRGPAVELRGRHDLLSAALLHATPARNGAERPNAPRPSEPGSSEPVPAVPGAADHAAPPPLAAGGLCKSFGGITAVRDVGLSVGDQEILGIIGANGAGKTTLFDLVCGHTRSDAGWVHLGGRDVSASTPAERARKGLGRSFQDARLFPSLTVEECLAVACDRWVTCRDPFSAALRLPRAYASELRTTRRVDDLLDLLGLGDHRDKPVGQLPTGTRRIVELGCLLAHRPRVVLLDEPSTGLARPEVEALAPMLGRVRAETGACVVLIEHDIPFVRTLADRLIAMDDGTVVAEGRPDEVLTDPTVVAAYLGDGPSTDLLSPR